MAAGRDPNGGRGQWSEWDSNPRHRHFQCRALPTELSDRGSHPINPRRRKKGRSPPPHGSRPHGSRPEAAQAPLPWENLSQGDQEFLAIPVLAGGHCRRPRGLKDDWGTGSRRRPCRASSSRRRESGVGKTTDVRPKVMRGRADPRAAPTAGAVWPCGRSVVVRRPQAASLDSRLRGNDALRGPDSRRDMGTSSGRAERSGRASYHTPAADGLGDGCRRPFRRNAILCVRPLTGVGGQLR